MCNDLYIYTYMNVYTYICMWMYQLCDRHFATCYLYNSEKTDFVAAILEIIFK